MQPLQGKAKRPLLFRSFIGITAILVASGVLATRILTRPCPDENEKRVWGTCYRDLQAKPLTVGILNVLPERNYQPLAAHLQNQLGTQVEVDSTPFNKISERVARRDWDIAFTISPVFSMTAEDNGYIGAALMFPNLPYYRTALFVRADSPIQSIADIKSTTTIALGGPESVPYFHLPIYALYGKSLRLGRGYTAIEAMAAVRAKKVDVASGLYYDVVGNNPTLKAITVKDDPDLRMIYVSKTIPNAGVYLSPKLASRDRELIKQALFSAPPEIQIQANYGDRPIPKYDEVRKITNRTEVILKCPGLNMNAFDLRKPVNLFCRNPDVIEGQFRLHVVGQISEYKVPTRDNVELKVVTQAGQVYRVLVSRQILNQTSINSTNAVDQPVQLNDVEARKLSDGIWEVKITQPNQLSLLKY